MIIYNTVDNNELSKYDYYYLAGQMSGIEDFNYPAFFKTAEEIEQKYEIIVHNPATAFEGDTGLSRDKYIYEGITYLTSAAGIILFGTWQNSLGAKLEYEIARQLNLPIYYYASGILFKIEEPETMLQTRATQPTPTPTFETAQPGGSQIADKSGGCIDGCGCEEHDTTVCNCYACASLRARVSNIPLDDVSHLPKPNTDSRNQLPHEVAEELVHGARQSNYGHPIDNFTATAKMWTGTLYYKLKPGVEVSAEDVALMMTQVKIAREQNLVKEDNLIDAHGYLMAYKLVIDERRNRVFKGLNIDFNTLEK